eukprot:TRINITY_DN477_c0_g1_i1.p1 TRINITY_DN477_c0_g1~~TRINITY_DN477_c0_g1_i1.p1  ORF type:complete len:134 (-),score=18.66 TRINITY_DN477_c0_g1_i1:32-433(-)
MDTPLLTEMDKIFAVFLKAVREGSGVLIHCQAGISRSASFVIAYLMKHHSMTLREAYFLVKEKKPDIQPNKGFMAQLVDYELSLFSQSTFSIELYLQEVLVSMGFEEGKAKRALEMSGYNFELAVSACLMDCI